MKNSKSLGKGLSALLGNNQIIDNSREASINMSQTNHSHKNMVSFIGLEEIVVSKYQPRKVFNEDLIKELSESIKLNGVLQPIILRKTVNEKFEIVAGERRWRAAQLANLETIPAIVRDLSDKEVLEISLLENIQREDLTPIEEALSYKRLLEEFDYTQDELANKVSKSRSYITNIIRLLGLEEEIRNFINEGKLTIGHAKILVGKDNAIEFAKKAINEDLSVRQLENLIYGKKFNNDNIKEQDTKPKKIIEKEVKVTPFNNEESYPEKSEDIIEIENSIYANLGLKTYVQHQDDRGKVVIYYNNLEELDGLIQKLTN